MILKTIYSLAQNRNGLFKSNKQRDFINSYLKERHGLAGHDPNGKYSVHAKSDEYGITHISHCGYKTNRTYIKFERRGVIKGLLHYNMMNETYDDYNARVKKIKEMQSQIHSMIAPFMDFALDEDKLFDMMKYLSEQLKDYRAQIDEYWDGTLRS